MDINKLAPREGWGIFEADGSQCNEQGNWPYQLQKCDDDDKLANDTAAHELVVAGAKKGKKLHLAALQFLRDNSKPELDLIYRAYLTDGQVQWQESILTHDRRLDGLERDIFGKIITTTQQGE